MGTPKSRENRAFFDYAEAFSRNIGIISEQEQASLRDKCVALPGCGGVGSLHALACARSGIGRYRLADFDQYEVANFNRQFGARISTLHQPKVETVQRDVLDINPDAKVEIFREGLTAENVGKFLEGVDVVIDSLDFFAFGARDVLFPAARERGIAVITAAPLGLSSGLLIFGARSMPFRRYFDFSPKDDAFRRSVKFALGLTPAALQRSYMDPSKVDLKNGKGPSHVVGVTLCAALAVTEALRILLNRGGVRYAPHFLQFDAYRGKLRRGYLWNGNRNPLQRLKMWFVRNLLLRAHR